MHVVGSQAVVGEQVLLAGIEEQLGVRGRRDESAGASTSPSPTKSSSASIRCIWTGTSCRQAPPNSEVGTQEWNSRAPLAPGRVWASICAGRTPRENPA